MSWPLGRSRVWCLVTDGARGMRPVQRHAIPRRVPILWNALGDSTLHSRSLLRLRVLSQPAWNDARGEILAQVLALTDINQPPPHKKILKYALCEITLCEIKKKPHRQACIDHHKKDAQRSLRPLCEITKIPP